MKKITLVLFLGSSLGILSGMKEVNKKENTDTTTHVCLYALKGNTDSNFEKTSEEKDYDRIPSDKTSFCRNRVLQQNLSPRGIRDLPI